MPEPSLSDSDPHLNPPPLALTMGEPGGIAAEISFKAWAALKDKYEPGRPAFFLIDDPARLEKQFRLFGWPVQLATIAHPQEATEVFSHSLPVIPLTKGFSEALLDIRPGEARKETAAAVINSIEQAVHFARNGDASGVVTNPIQKSALNAAGFPHPGHTEFLGTLTEDLPMPKGFIRGPIMMLAAPGLRVIPATIHTPLKDVSAGVTKTHLTALITAAAQSLVRDLGIRTPRIAVAGLNPHAGEAGTIGREEIDILSPTIQTLRSKGINVFGPLPADSMFHEEAREQYDLAVTMYHDQGLIPIKTLSFYDAVNITLGLPIIRTSPDHGTGLAIATKTIAKADSLLAALYMADHMYRTRRTFDQMAAAHDKG